jgi:hypothetical protein
VLCAPRATDSLIGPLAFVGRSRVPARKLRGSFFDIPSSSATSPSCTSQPTRSSAGSAYAR